MYTFMYVICLKCTLTAYRQHCNSSSSPSITQCIACACYAYRNPPIGQPKTYVWGCLYRGEPAQVTWL